MSAALFILASVGLIGGIGLITMSNKKLNPITFPDTFYENLKYFKIDNINVFAVMKDNNTETIFTGSTSSASKYFSQVQIGFENWLTKNEGYKEDGVNSKVVFS